MATDWIIFSGITSGSSGETNVTVLPFNNTSFSARSLTVNVTAGNITKFITINQEGALDNKHIIYTAPEKLPDVYGSFTGSSATGASGVHWAYITPTPQSHTFSNGVGILTFSATVQSLGYAAFAGCSGMTSLFIADGLTELGGFSFFNCVNLKYFSIPNTITEIGAHAFQGCTKLEGVTIPECVTAIKGDAFQWCENLKSITIPSEITEIDSRVFSGCRSLKSIEIPEGVTRIGLEAFAGCNLLETINIPSGVTYIGQEAFRDCPRVSSYVIPDGITNLYKWTFAHIWAPNSIKNILSSVTIPDSVTRIRDGAFRISDDAREDLTMPLVFHYKGTMAQWGNITKDTGWVIGSYPKYVECTDGTINL